MMKHTYRIHYKIIEYYDILAAYPQLGQLHDYKANDTLLRMCTVNVHVVHGT